MAKEETRENKLEKKSETRPSSEAERVPVRRPFFSPLEELFAPMRVFENFLRPSHFFGWPEERMMTPSMDIEETENEFVVNAEVPGFDKDEIKVECSDDQLTISAERSGTEKDRRGSRRYASSFYRSLALPQGVEAEKIWAECENGILSVHIPRVEAGRSRRIEIGAKSGETREKTKESDGRTTH
jgi:HSP20 family protein